MVETVFKALDAGVALVGGPRESIVVHLLGDVFEHVAVLQGAPEGELHRVLAPDAQQGAGLMLRPGHPPARVCLGEEAACCGLFVYQEQKNKTLFLLCCEKTIVRLVVELFQNQINLCTRMEIGGMITKKKKN